MAAGRLDRDAERALHAEACVAGHRAEEPERALARERHRDRLALPGPQDPRALLVRDDEVVAALPAVAHDEAHGRAGRDAPSREREREVARVDRIVIVRACAGAAPRERDGSEDGHRQRRSSPLASGAVACHSPEASPACRPRRARLQTPHVGNPAALTEGERGSAVSDAALDAVAGRARARRHHLAQLGCRRSGAPRRRRPRSRAGIRRRPASGTPDVCAPRRRSAGRSFRAGGRGRRGAGRARCANESVTQHSNQQFAPALTPPSTAPRSQAWRSATSTPCRRQTASAFAVLPPDT